MPRSPRARQNKSQARRYGGPGREDEWRVQYVIYGFRLQVRISLRSPSPLQLASVEVAIV